MKINRKALKGYNPRKPSRKSHHLLIVYANDLKLAGYF
jgi:hypothetical protein